MKLEKKDPIDILETYTKKIIQREKNKKFYKSRLWQKKLAQKQKQKIKEEQAKK